MQAQSSNKTEGNDYKILIVDDSNAQLHLLEDWLSESGFSVSAVHDGYEAISRFNSEHFDLVLTDIGLPDLNGNILAQYIHYFRKEVAVIAVTDSPGFANSDFDLVLSKPAELEGLVTSLQYVLQKYPPNHFYFNAAKRRVLYQCEQEIKYVH